MISFVLKLLVCFALLLIASPISAMDNTPRIRKTLFLHVFKKFYIKNSYKISCYLTFRTIFKI